MGVPAIIPEAAFISSPVRPLRSTRCDNGCSMSVELYRLLLRKLAATTENWIETSATNTPSNTPLQSVFAIRIPTSSEDILAASQCSQAGNTNTNTFSNASGTSSSNSGAFRTQHIEHAELLTLQEAWPQRHSSEVYLVLADPSAAASGLGWQARNLLALLALHAPPQTDEDEEGGGGCTVRIIGLRGSTAKKILRFVKFI